MKKFINKKTGHGGIEVMRSGDEVQVRIAGNPVLWNGTPAQFAEEWVAAEGEPLTVPAITPPDESVLGIYHYFISFIAGGRIGNTGVRSHKPIESSNDISSLETAIADSNKLEDLRILNFRLFDEPIAAVEWAESAYPALKQLIKEIRQVPNWAGYFEPVNRRLLEKLSDYVYTQEEIQAGLVEAERPAGETVSAKTNPA